MTLAFWTGLLLPNKPDGCGLFRHAVMSESTRQSAGHMRNRLE